MNKNKNKPIILVALEEELPESMLPEFIIEYTGVGKINATYRTLEAIQKYNPEIIINFGTAGTLNKNIFGLNEIKIFIQRDMDASKLGFNLGETPFDYISTIKFDQISTSTKSWKKASIYNLMCSNSTTFRAIFEKLLI